MSANERSGRRWAVAALTVVVCIAPSLGALAVGSAPPDTAASVAVSDSTADEAPDPATPESTTPATAAPETTTGQTTPTPSVVGEDTDDSTTLTWIAIVAAIALLGLAVWWMLRRGDDSTDVQRMDDDWPSDSSVI